MEDPFLLSLVGLLLRQFHIIHPVPHHDSVGDNAMITSTLALPRGQEAKLIKVAAPARPLRTNDCLKLKLVRGDDLRRLWNKHFLDPHSPSQE